MICCFNLTSSSGSEWVTLNKSIMGDSLWSYMWIVKSPNIFKQLCEPSFDAHLKNQITISLSWKKALKSSGYHLEKPWIAPERETSLFIRQKHWLCLSYHLISPNHPWQLSRASQFAFFLMVTYPCSQVPCHTQHRNIFLKKVNNLLL